MEYNLESKKSQHSTFLNTCLILVFCLSYHLSFAQIGYENEIIAAETSHSSSTIKTTASAKTHDILLEKTAVNGIIDLAMFEIPEGFNSIQILNRNKKLLETMQLPQERNAFLKLDVTMFRKGTYYLKVANKKEVFSLSKFELI